MSRRSKILSLLIVAFLLLGFWLVSPGPGVPILAYHMVSDLDEVYSVNPSEFDLHMRYLSEQGYQTISLAEFIEARNGKGKLPPKPIIITFDDGYADNYLTALPIMEKYGFRATVFVIAGKVGQEMYLTWDQIKAMQARRTEIGSHTLSHSAMGKITSDEKKREAILSKKILEENLGTKVSFLAYPYGSFDEESFTILKEAGYLGACTGLAGLNLPKDNSYRLKRVNLPHPKYGLWEFRIRLWRANLYGNLGI